MRGDVAAKVVGEGLTLLEMKDQEQLFADHGALWPDVVGGEDAEFLYGQAFERGFDVFGIDVLAFLGDNHVFLAAEELEMTCGIEAAEVAGHEPTVDDGFGGEFGLVEVAGHNRFAADGDFADAICVGIDDADLHAGEWLADGVGAKGL